MPKKITFLEKATKKAQRNKKIEYFEARIFFLEKSLMARKKKSNQRNRASKFQNRKMKVLTVSKTKNHQNKPITIYIFMKIKKKLSEHRIKKNENVTDIKKYAHGFRKPTSHR